MKRTHSLIAGVVAGVALAVAAATYAQPFGGMGQGYGPGPMRSRLAAWVKVMVPVWGWAPVMGQWQVSILRQWLTHA